MSRTTVAIVRLLPGLAVVTVLAGPLASPAVAQRPLSLEIDATDLPRKLVRARLEIPIDAASRREGRLALWYPKWIPGTHGPSGPVQNLVGLVLSDENGERLEWAREPGEVYRINVDVPRSARAVVAELEYVASQPSTNSRGVDSFGSDLIGIVNANTVLLVPEDVDVTRRRVRASLRLPDDWTVATALDEIAGETRLGPDDDDAPQHVRWAETSLAHLVDSPLLLGRHARAFDLVDDADLDRIPPHVLTIFSEVETAVSPPEDVVDLYRAMVAEAAALFGGHPFDHYDVLLGATKVLPRNGLEHLDSSLNVIPHDSIRSVKELDGWDAYLVPHEYVHAWCGKHRRPAGMVTTNFHDPKDTRLLWVYEGLAQHLGALVAVRAGITTPEDYRWSLQRSVRRLRHRQGRAWRSLSDTAAASHVLRGGSASWGHLRRGQDYYSEGALIWLEVDAVIRRLTNGRHDLDDFCRRFFGDTAGEPAPHPYTREDLVAVLQGLAPHDWEAFFAERVDAPSERLATRVVEELGHLVQYDNTLPEGPDDAKYDRLDLRDSLGATFQDDGTVNEVLRGTPADRAGLGPGMRILGIDDHVWSADRLVDAVAASASREAIELLVVTGERLERRALRYDGGPRFMVLVRDESRPDVLDDVLRPRRPNAAPTGDGAGAGDDERG